mmetsp:Transcript_19199/g.44118  ORF Transcript_19199/g.44118 Transcript_19199/m.44118 type:complete len:90 (-) Transcript_19199:60-329(-)
MSGGSRYVEDKENKRPGGAAVLFQYTGSGAIDMAGLRRRGDVDGMQESEHLNAARRGARTACWRTLCSVSRGMSEPSSEESEDDRLPND